MNEYYKYLNSLTNSMIKHTIEIDSVSEYSLDRICVAFIILSTRSKHQDYSNIITEHYKEYIENRSIIHQSKLYYA